MTAAQGIVTNIVSAVDLRADAIVELAVDMIRIPRGDSSPGGDEEPTNLELLAATKGGQTYKVKVPGGNVHHAWWWEGVSAFDKAIS